MKKYKPFVDKLFYIITVPTLLLVVAMTVLSAFEPSSLALVIPMDIVIIYLLISPLFGYAELREDSLFIKYGLILKKELPYGSIRDVVKERRAYSNSMLSLKNAFEHVDIKYDSFAVTTVSVVDNDGFIKELKKRIS